MYGLLITLPPDEAEELFFLWYAIYMMRKWYIWLALLFFDQRNIEIYIFSVKLLKNSDLYI